MIKYALIVTTILTGFYGYSQVEAKCRYGMSNTKIFDLATNEKGTLCLAGEKHTFYKSGTDCLDFRVVMFKRDRETDKYSKFQSVTYNRWSKGSFYKTTKDANCIVSLFNDTSFVAVYNRLNLVMSSNSKTHKAAYSGWKSMPKCVGYSKIHKKCVGLTEFDNHVYHKEDNSDYNSVYAFHNNKENTGIVESKKSWSGSGMSKLILDRAADVVTDQNGYVYLIGKNGYDERPLISSMDFYGFKRQVKDEEGKAGGFASYEYMCEKGEDYIEKTAKYSKKNSSIYYLTKNESTGSVYLQVINLNNGKIESPSTDFPGPDFKLDLSKAGLNSQYEFGEKFAKNFKLELYNGFLYLLSYHTINKRNHFYVHKISLEGKLIAEIELNLVANEKIKAKSNEITGREIDDLLVTDFCLVEDGYFAFTGYNWGSSKSNSKYGLLFTFKWK